MKNHEKNQNQSLKKEYQQDQKLEDKKNLMKRIF